MAVDGLEGRGGVYGDEVWGKADDGPVFEVGVVEGEMAVAEVGVVDIVPGLGDINIRIGSLYEQEGEGGTNQSVIRARNGPGCFASGCR